MVKICLNLFLIIVLLFFSLACHKSFDVGLAPGQLAPDFQLKKLNGEVLRLSDLRGRKVLLNFWASWCLPCAQEVPSLEKLSKISPENFVVLGVAVEDLEKDVAQFVSEYQVSFPIVLDKDSKVKNQYAVSGFPESFLIDPEGKIKLIMDPNKQSLEAKISGPREWDSPALLEQLLN